jgi:hypothetical protein
MGIFNDLQQIRELAGRTSESIGGPFSDPFNEIATVVSVSDPKKLGRVKVEYQDGLTSDWVYVLGSNKGLLSSQFVGATCLIGKANGNSEDAFVLGFFNRSAEDTIVGSPIQLVTLSEQDQANSSPSSPGDRGMQCNEGNAGRVYLLSNEISQDAVICLRRNNTQESTDNVWAWKSLTNSKWVEKGYDPGVSQSPSTTNLSEKKGIPQCSQALEGEIHEFTEDRKFRSFPIICRRDENGDFGWSPASAPPVVFRTTLPNCTEKLHGMEAILDAGRDSELVICLRYQGQMKWVQQGKREPMQFHREDPPLTRQQFLDSKKPVEALKQNATPASSDFIGGAAKAALAVAGKSATPFLPSTPLGVAAKLANVLPQAFDKSGVLSGIANTVIANNSTLPIGSIVSQLTDVLGRGGSIDDEMGAVLKTLGGAADVLVRGAQNGTIDDALEEIGQRALSQALGTLSPQVGSIFNAYMAGGALGAIDIAAMLNFSQLPPEVNQLLSPVLAAVSGALDDQPSAISGIINAATGTGDTALPDIIGKLTSLAPQSGQLVDLTGQALSSGKLGDVAQLINSFGNLSSVPKISGFQDVPQLASTALELVGMGEQFASLMKGGIGLDNLASLTGLNPVANILGGLGGLKGLLGGGGGGQCPCDPKCRKTEHGKDSDGNSLLEKCGNVVATSHSSFDPNGDPTKNNENPISKLLDLIPTKIGEDLCTGNVFDLTQIIKTVKRLMEMADRFEGSKEADWPEFFSEMTYTFEAIEKALKQADNNITGVESVERKLIDAQYRMLRKFMSGSTSYFPQALKDVRENSKAIKDLYQYVKRLDNVKDGGRAGVAVTENIAAAFTNIRQIPKLSSLSRKEATRIISSAIKPAHKEWKDLEPGGELLNLADIILGAFNPAVPLNFDKCKTKRDKNKVLKDSLESKLNSPVPPNPDSLLDASVPEESRKRPGVPSILDQIKYEQGRAEKGEADC